MASYPKMFRHQKPEIAAFERDQREKRDRLRNQLVDAIGRVVRANIDYEAQYARGGCEGPPYTVSVERGAADDALAAVLKEVLP
jgi:hypothetical protein